MVVSAESPGPQRATTGGDPIGAPALSPSTPPGATSRPRSRVDALGARLLVDQGGLAPSDLAAIQAAADDVGAIERRQAETIAAVQGRLGV